MEVLVEVEEDVAVEVKVTLGGTGVFVVVDVKVLVGVIEAVEVDVNVDE